MKDLKAGIDKATGTAMQDRPAVLEESHSRVFQSLATKV